MGSACDTISGNNRLSERKRQKSGSCKSKTLQTVLGTAFYRSNSVNSKENYRFWTEQRSPGSVGEPLYLDVVAALAEAQDLLMFPYTADVTVLGSKDTTPAADYRCIQQYRKEAFHNRYKRRCYKPFAAKSKKIRIQPPTGITSCKFWGLGADGTVGANKNSVKIIGDHTDMNVQAYFDYDSKKSGGLTVAHISVSENAPITSTYLINKADFRCLSQGFIHTDSTTWYRDVKPGGVFLLNCSWNACRA